MKWKQKDYDRNDFGKDVIPYMVKANMKVLAYGFHDENRKTKPYWKDIGTIESYFESSMDLISVTPEFNFYDLELAHENLSISISSCKNGFS